MFGYVMINKPEMKIKDYETYHAYYCGLCRAMGREHGTLSRLSVNYDLTFLALLLTGLYDAKTEREERRCVAHPVHRHPSASNRFVDYAADMNVYLAYLKARDDWQDDRSLAGGAYARILEKKARLLERKYPERLKTIREYMDLLAKREQENCQNLDEVSGTFGNLMKAIFTLEDDVFARPLADMGFFLGKFIYMLDAYEDLEEDEKSGNYNPLLFYRNREDFETFIREALLSTMAECCRAFEYLPIEENLAILRNILYSGVWTKYRLVRRKKEGNQEGKPSDSEPPFAPDQAAEMDENKSK